MLTVERFVSFHLVPLPKNLSSRDDINAFEVELKGADDFAQISVNNYVDPTTERISDLISFQQISLENRLSF